MKFLSKTLRPLIGAAALLSSLLLLEGCSSPLIQVQSRLVESQRDAPREVTGTPAYAGSLPKITNVAVRAPDSCLNQTASGATGSASNTASILTTRCGVEMAELERALTRVGYVVTSWRDLNVAVGQENLSAKAAAQKLGAQVLFQVNSLEKVKLQPGQDARWERAFFKANREGAMLGPAELRERDVAALRRMAGDEEKKILEHVRFGAMLDVNAIAVDTGQTIWFYRLAKAQAASKDNSVTFTAERIGSGWRLYSPSGKKSDERTAMVKSGEVEAISTSGQSANQEETIYFQLMREVIKDFAEEFKSGRAGK